MKVKSREFEEHFEKFLGNVVEIFTIYGRAFNGVVGKVTLSNGRKPTDDEFSIAFGGGNVTIIAFKNVANVRVDLEALSRFAIDKRKTWSHIATDSNGLVDGYMPQEYVKMREECLRAEINTYVEKQQLLIQNLGGV